MSPVAPTLPAGTALGFSYEYGVDINLGTPGAPNWQPIRRPSAIAPAVTPITASAQSYDDFGAPNDTKTSESWSLAFAVQVNRLVSGLYAPEVEKLKSYTEPDAVGALSVAHVRWYDKPYAGTPNPNDAYEGFAYVTIERANTGNADTGTWTVTLTGQGKRTKIANPFTGWTATAPVINAATPSGAVAGSLVTITGSQFLGATLVKFGAVNATVYSVQGGSTIVAVVPAGAAGVADITVTNAIGISAAFAYTRGA